MQGVGQDESVCDMNKGSGRVIIRCEELARMSQYPVSSRHLTGNLAQLAKWHKGSFITLHTVLQ